MSKRIESTKVKFKKRRGRPYHLLLLESLSFFLSFFRYSVESVWPRGIGNPISGNFEFFSSLLSQITYYLLGFFFLVWGLNYNFDCQQHRYLNIQLSPWPTILHSCYHQVLLSLSLSLSLSVFSIKRKPIENENFFFPFCVQSSLTGA